MRSEEDQVKVLSFYLSPVCCRVVWALRLKGVDYEYVEEDIFNKSNLLLQMNPLHKKVPVLIHRLRPVSDSLIILEYIDETWITQNPLLPQHPHHRSLARFWAKFAEEKILYGAFRAMGSDGDNKENAAKLVREDMEKIEELIKGKKFFGGENIGYLDIAFGWMSYWLPVWEQVGNMQILDPFKCPNLALWMSNFLNDPIVKDTLPPRDKMVLYFHDRFVARNN
ncbi:probable glutathione S-transferase [Prosopis cineraria]|uniref:probable glutathione S-transferase n=1 Tax=Prosopis cineraria TaxID=364024 RepID=UPI00240F641F|nr:probable glutathione S-transferase [Prosopis cineraria]